MEQRVRFTVHRTVGEARLQAGLLEGAGLSVEVRGEGLAPLGGEIPATETWVELWPGPAVDATPETAGGISARAGGALATFRKDVPGA